MTTKKSFTFCKISFTVYRCFRRILICLNLDIVKSAAEVGGKIGEPVPLAQANANQGSCYLLQLKMCSVMVSYTLLFIIISICSLLLLFKLFCIRLASGLSNQSKNPNTLHPRNDNTRPTSMHSPKPSGKLFGQDGPTTPGGSQVRVMPIASLTPYQNR